MNLTSDQLNVIHLNSGSHLVLAPPGSGKTELLSQRITYAQHTYNIDSANMLCLTFTNRAARNMIERISNKKQLFIGTFHTFCTNLLFSENAIPKQTYMLPEDEAKDLMDEAIQAILLEENITPTRKISTYTLLKYNAYINQYKLNFPDHLRTEIPKDFDLLEKSHLKQICKRYEKLKYKSICMDFDDIIHHTIYLLKHTKIKPYEWIQIDEVQDLNVFQWEIIDLIKSKNTHIVMFGDLEQCIYSFIGARKDILLDKAKGSDKHVLSVNFRSPSYLLNVYNSFSEYFFSNNWRISPKAHIQQESNDDELIYIKKEGSKHAEIQFLAEKIIPYYSEKGNIAILTRSNRTSDDVAGFLQGKDVPFFKISGFDLFSRAVIKDILAFLTILVSPTKKSSWIRLFHLFAKNLTLTESKKTVEEIYELGIQPMELALKKQPYVQKLLDFKTKRVVLFDTETTGLDTKNDDIIQIAAIELINGVIGREFEVFLQTNKSLEDTVDIHKIDQNLLQQKGKNRKQGLLEFISFINNAPLIAHNIQYDWKILQSNMAREEINDNVPSVDLFDTVQISKQLFPREKSYKLEHLLSSFKLDGVNSHNALDDVKATVNLLLHQLKHAELISNTIQSFLEDNSKQIEKFRDASTNILVESYKRKKEDISVVSIIESFLNYSKQTLNYQLKDSDQTYINKLLNHIRANEKGENLAQRLHSLVHDYERYKESDLLIGNEKIVISTIHKAKGLEFDTVIIPECNTGVYPSQQSTDIEEEKRLFYVALTRAKKSIILSSHSNVSDYHFQQKQVDQSPFLEPILKHFKVLTR